MVKKVDVWKEYREVVVVDMVLVIMLKVIFICILCKIKIYFLDVLGIVIME